MLVLSTNKIYTPSLIISALFFQIGVSFELVRNYFSLLEKRVPIFWCLSFFTWYQSNKGGSNLARFSSWRRAVYQKWIWAVLVVLASSFSTIPTTRYGGVLGISPCWQRLMGGCWRQQSSCSDGYPRECGGLEELEDGECECRVCLEEDHLSWIVRAHYGLRVGF